MDSEKTIRSIREQIAEHIRSDIFSGKLDEGEQLRETPLAERFGVSRGPIRDVLLQLSQEGLLISKPNKISAINWSSNAETAESTAIAA